jgi:hypothetical protein
MAINTEQIVGFLRKNPVGVSCTSLVIVMGVYLGFRYDALPDAETQLVATTELADRLGLNLKNSAQLPEQLKELRDSTARLDTRLVHPADLATNLQYFYKLVADTGTKLIELRQLQPAPGQKKEGPFTPVSYVVSVRGPYAQVMALVASLENGHYFSRIQSATVAPAQPAGSETDDTSADLVTITLNLDLLGV